MREKDRVTQGLKGPLTGAERANLHLNTPALGLHRAWPTYGRYACAFLTRSPPTRNAFAPHGGGCRAARRKHWRRRTNVGIMSNLSDLPAQIMAEASNWSDPPGDRRVPDSWVTVQGRPFRRATGRSACAVSCRVFVRVVPPWAGNALIGYSPFVRPVSVGGVKCVLVDPALRELEVMAPTSCSTSRATTSCGDRGWDALAADQPNSDQNEKGAAPTVPRFSLRGRRGRVVINFKSISTALKPSPSRPAASRLLLRAGRILCARSSVGDRIDDSRRAAQHLGSCFLAPPADCLAYGFDCRAQTRVARRRYERCGRPPGGRACGLVLVLAIGSLLRPVCVFAECLLRVRRFSFVAGKALNYTAHTSATSSRHRRATSASPSPTSPRRRP